MSDNLFNRTSFNPGFDYLGNPGFDQVLTDFNLEGLLPDNDSWASRFEAQLIDSPSQDSSFANSHCQSETNSGSGTPALEQNPALVNVSQPAIGLFGNAAPPPKIGARFSREAVRVLRQWVSTHSDHPFPSDQEKDALQHRTGLNKTQILNWLANARRRGKIQARPLPGSPQCGQSPTSSTHAIDIPRRKPTPAPGDRARLMNPLERWVDSPPESEPATATAIARAMASSSRSSFERWACTPNGPCVTEFNGLLRCAFCSEPSPDDAHFNTHNYAVCRERPLQERSFNRKDHLTQHLRLVHNVKPEQLGCPLNEWKLPMPAIRSVCGFCGLKMDTWEFRVDHLADHFKTGTSMKEWKGDWGFDPSVLFRVEHAIPPYVIGTDHTTVYPFEASAGPSATPRNAYELIKIELDHFVHVYSDKFGGLPTFDKMQLEACRILLSAEVISDGEDADASWLRDLIISNDEILKEAKIRPVRSILEGKLRRLTIPGKDGLFDLCSLESQLHDFVQAGPSTSFTDAELQKEASRILRQVEIESNPPAEYVSAFLLDLANSSTAWLIRFRERHKLTRPEIFSSGRSGSLSEINSILQNYSELERTLTDYVELLQAHGIVPDDTALRQKANDIIEQINDPTWKTVALNNEAWLAKFKSRHLPDTSTQPSTALQSPEPHAWGITPQQPSNSDNTNAWMRSSFILNGDCFYRWIARELARWVAMTMSPNNPNQHVPTDEEIQHHARWIVYNDGDPWNQTVADNPVWLRQFKIDVGVLKPSEEDSVGVGSQDLKGQDLDLGDMGL
ncbi:hypothetical protein FDECE_2098 [Fusarium decemcellulare]|nr:hypothetical protein FDECE_2098 [Fusarium decemcellulare]